MLTSKQRAELRAQANMLETTLMVGKGGLSAQLISETEKLLDAKELIKGRVLETAMLSARECCDALCEATGADGIQVVGSKFVLYRKSAKLEQERQAKKKLASVRMEVKNGKVQFDFRLEKSAEQYRIPDRNLQIAELLRQA